MPYRSRLRLLTGAGMTLGELHRELAGFKPEAVHHLGFRSATLDRTHDLAWYRETLDGLRLRQYSVPPERASDADELWRRADEIESRLDRLGETLERADLPRVVIHGDFGIHNLVFRADGTVVVFDFELARLEWRLIDLVIVLSRALPQSGRAFLEGYRRSNQIHPSEWELIPLVWEFHLLAGAVRSWGNFVDQGGAHRITRARRRLDEAGSERAAEVARWL
jgi:Ser/Thr protein kinase RdoA (MazF antagonist)